MLKNVKTASILVVLLHASLAVAQTKAAKPSAVGVWKMDMKQSKFGSQPPPKSFQRGQNRQHLLQCGFPRFFSRENALRIPGMFLRNVAALR